jgi:uncharacterized radical SAM superfamily Fe-S cluster-containing enzyme
LIKECQRPEIGRVTINSNGLRLASDEDFCRALADLGVYVILSFNTLRSDTSQVIHGRDLVAAKRSALENLQRFGIGTTLLNVMVRGVNEDEIGAIIELATTYDNVRSITIQTMTFTGKGGKYFKPRNHMPLDGAANAIEKTTGGAFRANDFFPHAGAHPLCYSIAYYLREGQRCRSFTDFFSIEELRRMLGAGYLLQPDATSHRLFLDAIDRLWTSGDNSVLLPRLKRLISKMFPSDRPLSPSQRQAIAEENILTIYIHAHMDEDTLDLARLVACPDQVPDPEGRLVPACAYNLFYRQNDPRFWQQEENRQFGPWSNAKSGLADLAD